VKMSAKFATWSCVSHAVVGWNAGGNKNTFKLFLVSRTFASASQASIPSVLPKNLTSSTSLFSFRAWIWGSISSAVVSFRPLPSSEKSLDMLTSNQRKCLADKMNF
jgi:hypothetical protein